MAKTDPYWQGGTPEDYTPESKYNAWWKCPKCGYEYRRPINLQVEMFDQGKERCVKCRKTEEKNHGNFMG